MPRRLAGLSLAFLASVLVATAVAAPATAQDTDAEAGADSPATARAWVLADADSGTVLAALNHREPLLVASLVKVMTAIVALEHLEPGSEVPVSDLAAAQPAMRIGMETGESWDLEDALHALLMVSANDVAYALAEAAGASLEGFAQLMQQTADRLGMQDSTWLDPAGLDGEEGFGGGTRASALDLAIMARNALESPTITEIAPKPTYEFVGGGGRQHRLVNHNKLLASFPDLTGLKTGFTRAAGHTYIGTAERDGRRLIAVVIGAVDHYGTASALLSQGFNTPPDASGTGEVLPDIDLVSFAAPDDLHQDERRVADATARSSGLVAGMSGHRLGFGVFVILLATFIARREQIKRRKRRRRAMRRRYLDAARRGMIDVIDADRYHGPQASLGTDGSGSRHVQVVRSDNARIAALERSHQRVVRDRS